MGFVRTSEEITRIQHTLGNVCNPSASVPIVP